MHTRFFRRILLVALCAAAAACGHKAEDSTPPVATPTVSFSKPRVPIGSAVTITYKFVVAPNAPAFDADYWVFVHVVDPEGEQMWTDDHQPPVPTRQWTPGRTIEYSRTVFVPNYPYVGEATVRIGLYDMTTNKRLPLNATDATRREYTVAKIQILPSSENVYLIPKDGWQPAENDPRNPQNEWQWTLKNATLSFKNPKRDSTFYLQYDARADLFTPPQQVTLTLNGQSVGQFVADAKLPAIKTFPLSAAQLGPDDTDTLTFTVDRTFKPGGTDPRELGIRIFHTYLEPK